jgi:hypothetical protein
MMIMLEQAIANVINLHGLNMNRQYSARAKPIVSLSLINRKSATIQAAAQQMM